MFADALLDSRHLGSSRRGWATLTSFGLQAALVACLLIVPLLYTQGLPHVRWASPVAVPYIEPIPVRVEQVVPQQQNSGAILSARPSGAVIHVPTQIPGHIDMAPDTGTADLPNIGDTCVRCGNAAVPSVLIAGSGPGMGPHVLGPKAPPVRISAMMEGLLIHRVEPAYPALAKIAGIQGSVVIAAVIGKDGSVENLQVVSGHPMLVKSALDAVRQWRYRPYILNGSPIEVDTQITVNFILSR
jgi:protein TonB